MGRSDFSCEINGVTLEYVDETHQYLADGILVPSITQIVRYRFCGKYDNVSPRVLQAAAERGTEIHESIERLVCEGIRDDREEVRNFEFLQKAHGFGAVNAEIPVILFDDALGYPIAAGRIDLVLTKRVFEKPILGLADIKCTSALDRMYLAYQLNLYRLAYQQSYDEQIGFLAGVWLRGEKRKFVDIPINEDAANDLIHEYFSEVRQ